MQHIKRFECDHYLEHDGVNVKKESSFDSQPFPPSLDHGDPLFLEYGEPRDLEIILFKSMILHHPFDRGRQEIHMRINVATMAMIETSTSNT